MTPMSTSMFVCVATLALVLHPAIMAQDEAVAPAPALVVRTGHPRLAEGLSMAARQDLPDLNAGEHYVVTMSAEGDLAVTTGNGAVPFVMVEARPRALMTIFADHVDEVRRLAKASASVGAAGSGMRPAQMAGLMDAIFDFPQQIDAVTVRVDGDEEKGWDAHAEVVPLARGAFERGVTALRSSGKGAPRLDDGAVSLACDLHPSVLQTVYGGMADLVAGMVDEADRPAVRKLMEAQAAASDGTMAFAMAAGAIHMVLGCADADAMRKLLAGDEWVRMQRAFLANLPDAEVEITHEQVGDLDIVHTHGDLGTDTNPFAKDGKIEGWATVAGDAMVSVVYGGRRTFDRLVRTAAAGELERAPLPAGSVMTMRVDMAGMMAMSGRDAPRGMPASIELRLGKKGKGTLVVDVRVGM